MAHSSLLDRSLLPTRLVIASRESQLALWQAHHIQARLRAFYPEMDISILGMTTQGDQILDKSLSKIGGKGLFVKELEIAMLEGHADIAVHSMKDVPMALPEGFALAAICTREDPRDAFVSSSFSSLEDLPAGSIVGTSSLRREVQLRARFPHLSIQPLRGNVQTRLAKLDRGDYQAIILAAAGLKRLGLENRIRGILSPEDSLPAIAQGALGIECLAARSDLMALLAPLADENTTACVEAERAFGLRLNASCQVPLGAYATLENDQLRLSAFVSSLDAQERIALTETGTVSEAHTVGVRLAERMIAAGAMRLVEAAGEVA